MVDFSKKYTGTDRFRQLLIFFELNGYYLDFEDHEYWMEEERRCMEGYTLPDGQSVTGFHYFLLNYAPIKRAFYVERTNKRTGLTKIVIEKRTGFSRFFDYDAYFFEYCDELIWNGKFGLVAKARERGYSYKQLQMLLRNYTFIPGSKGYLILADSKYITGRDGMLPKCWDILDHLMKHTPWGKARTVDNAFSKRAGYWEIDPITKRRVERGFKSEISGITISDNPDAIRGIRGELMFFEESGVSPRLLMLWEAARPTMEHDGELFGFMALIGTGSVDNTAVQGLKELFYKPDAYNVQSVKNIWDKGLESQECGFYCPQYANMEIVDEHGKRLYMDEDGNTLIDEAKQLLEDNLQKLYKANADSRSIEQFLIEHSRCPLECFLVTGKSILPKVQLQEQEIRIRSTPILENLKQVGKLEMDSTGQMVWVQQKNGDITSFPLNLKDKLCGLIVIWEHPKQSTIPYQYVALVDPYDIDEAQNSTSLGSVFIWKRFCPGDDFSDCPVLEYTGRPETADEFYETTRKLCMYYNATIMCENMNRGIITYFKIKSCEHLLLMQPDGVLSDVLKLSSVHRGYGVHMTKEVKNAGIIWFNDKLREEYLPGVNRVHKILSVPLLQEISQWDGVMNADRISLMAVMMIYLKQLERTILNPVKREDNNLSRWAKPFFPNRRY